MYNTAIKEVHELDKELKKTDIESDRDFYDELYVGKIETLLDIKESVKNSILEEAINRDQLEILKSLGLFEIKVFKSALSLKSTEPANNILANSAEIAAYAFISVDIPAPSNAAAI